MVAEHEGSMLMIWYNPKPIPYVKISNFLEETDCISGFSDSELKYKD
jgi:hypothetical protein